MLLMGMLARYGSSYTAYAAKVSDESALEEWAPGSGRRELDWSGGSIAKYTWLRANERFDASSPCSDAEVALVGLSPCASRIPVSPGLCATYIDVGYGGCGAAPAP